MLLSTFRSSFYFLLYIKLKSKTNITRPSAGTRPPGIEKMSYTLSFDERTNGPINAIYFDSKHGGFWGGSSNHGEDYGIGW